MHDAQIRTSSNGVGADGEDLNVVLGRFQSWAAARKSPSSGSSSHKPGAREKGSASAAALANEGREISYDQAVLASRYRRHEDLFAPDPIPDSAPKVAEERLPIEGRAATPDVAPPATRWNDAENAELKSRVSRWPEFSFNKAASAVADLQADVYRPTVVVDPVAVRVVDPAPAARFVEAPTSVPASFGPMTAKGGGPAKQASPDGPAKSGHRVSPAAAVAEAPAEAAKPAPHDSRAESTFSEVLERISAKAAAAPVRSVCLTLQAADGEQARLQESGAKANLSSAVYLRQCSLGIDDLRIQIETALSRARREQQGKIGTRLGIIPFGVLQLGARCWRRLRRSDTGAPGLSAR